jgi:chemotaxis protein MotB
VAAPPKKCKKVTCQQCEKWAVPLADFFSLLLALFIALYAVSAANTDKRKGMAEAISQIFDFTPSAPSIMQNSGQDPTTGPVKSSKTLANHQQSQSSSKPSEEQNTQSQEMAQQMQSIKDKIPEIGNGSDSDIVMTSEGVRVRIFGPILFDPGSASLSQGSKRVIDMIAAILKDTPNQIKIEGFASEGATRGGIYPSNWELSTARSCSVIRQFIMNGLAPKRFIAVGYGDTRPLGQEKTTEQHYMNQRVEILIMNYSAKADGAPEETILDKNENK